MELAGLLGRHGYQISRQTGSHMRLTRIADGEEQHITIPRHQALRVGTLNSILGTVAGQLGVPKEQVVRALFG
jgi:predicted RNA binding protein YcfA (HicA-like mRNA interferase family)